MNDNKNQHPEQDPAEGSRETIERDLRRQDKKAGEQDPDKTDKGERDKR